MSQILEPFKDIPVFKDPVFWSKTTWIQLGYGMWANQVVVLIGLAFGFSAVAVPQLSGANSTFQSTLTQQAWIASVVSLTAPLGCLICGVVMDKIGRRWTLVICLLPMGVGWIYTALSKSATQMIYARIITGIGVGLCAGPPRTYTTEISLPNVRGVTGVIPTFSVSLGIFTQTLMGNLFKWQTIAYICSGYSLFVMVMNLFLPETPYFVLIGGDMERTKRCLRRIRAKDYNIDHEFEEMRSFRENNKIRKIPLKQTLLNLLQPHAYKPFVIIMLYAIAGQLSGISIMMFWTVDILKSSKVSLEPYVGNVFLGATRVLTGIVSSVLVFWLARRPLAIGSALSMGVLCISMGLFLSINDRPTIVPLLIYIVYIACAMTGFYTLPLLMLYEMIPLQIRGSLGGISVSLMFLIMFAVNASFPFVKNKMGMPATVILFGCFALLGSLYLYLFLPETKDLTLQEIEEFYRGRRKSLESIHRNSSIHRNRLTLQLMEASLQEQKQDEKDKEKNFIRHGSVRFKDTGKDKNENRKDSESKSEEKQDLKREGSIRINESEDSDKKMNDKGKKNATNAKET